MDAVTKDSSYDLTATRATVWADRTVASALDHVQQVGRSSGQTMNQRRAILVAELDIDEKHSPADWARRLVLHTHQGREVPDGPRRRR